MLSIFQPMYDVITFGALTRDVFVRSKALELHKERGMMEACFPFGAKLNVEDVVFETGGGAGNNAVTFARLAKMKTAVVASVGYDRSGDDIIDALKREKIETKLIDRQGREKTAYSTVLLSGVAERTILTYRGASAHISHAHIPWKNLSARLFYVSGLTGDLELLAAILKRAAKINARVFMNPGGGEFRQPKAKLLPLLAQLDLLIVNREEAAQLTGAPDADLKKIVAGIRKINRHAIVTDGRAGAYAITTHDILHAAIVPAKRVNLTGAGDAFGSAYAAAILAHHDLRSALAIGTLNATGVVQHAGAKVGILHDWPSPREIAKVKIKKIIL